MKDLLGKFGSFRRMVEAYWIGALSPQEEREIEDFVAKEMLASYKPVIVEAQIVHLGCEDHIANLSKNGNGRAK